MNKRDGWRDTKKESKIDRESLLVSLVAVNAPTFTDKSAGIRLDIWRKSLCNLSYLSKERTYSHWPSNKDNQQVVQVEYNRKQGKNSLKHSLFKGWNNAADEGVCSLNMMNTVTALSNAADAYHCCWCANESVKLFKGFRSACWWLLKTVDRSLLLS